MLGISIKDIKQLFGQLNDDIEQLESKFNEICL